MRDLKTADQAFLPEAIQHPSPNQDARPPDNSISLLVIHSISLPPGEYGGPWIDDFFLNRLDPNAHPYFSEIQDLRVSTHLLIRRDGQLIQYVPFNQRAWHAGESAFEGQKHCNDFSIGIELEGTDTQPYTQAQYATLAQATRELIISYPAITPERITGHADIAPDRKTDPGPAFDWQYYRDKLRSRT
ncbi:MAG: 1,6-anhydro-N-acetylmuramyl-L-alanine amidase AmpD [Pseudomonadota bacterium]